MASSDYAPVSGRIGDDDLSTPLPVNGAEPPFVANLIARDPQTRSLILAMLALAMLVTGCTADPPSAAEWTPVAIGDELAGWELVGVEEHPEFQRYEFRAGQESTVVEAVFDTNAGGLEVQPAPGQQPPPELLNQVRRRLAAAPDDLVASGQTNAAARATHRRRMSAEASLACIPQDEVHRRLKAGLMRDFSLVSNAGWIATILLLLATAVVGIVGLRRRREAWLGLPRSTARPDRLDWLIALLLMTVVLAMIAPGVVQALSTPPRGSTDAGIYAGMFWNALQGRGFYNTYEGMDHLGSHSSLGAFLLVPFYALAPGARALAIINTVQVVSALVPAYLLARVRLDRASALLVALLILSFPAFGGLLSEIHAVKSALPLFLWALYFLERQKPAMFVLFLLLTASFKENTSIVFVGLGACLLLHRDTRWAGGFVALLGAVVYVVGVHVVLPAHFADRDGASMSFYSHLGEGLFGLLASPFLRPDAVWAQLTELHSLRYFAAVFLSFALIPLGAPRQLLVTLPVLAQNVLSAKPALRSMGAHYDALLLPGLVFASVYALARFPRRTARVALLAAAFAGSFCASTFIGGSWPQTDSDLATAAARDALSYVPDGVSLVAPNELVPFAPRRATLLQLDGAGEHWTRVLPDYLVLPTGYQPEVVGVYEHFDLVYSNDDYQVFRDPRPRPERCGPADGDPRGGSRGM